MDDRPPSEGHVLRVAVASVLGDRMLDVLPGERVLQLRRRDRDAVQVEREIDRLVRVLVNELAHEREPVRFVAGDELWSQAVRRLEVSEADFDAQVFDAVP
jgi:hypothetical protein